MVENEDDKVDEKEKVADENFFEIEEDKMTKTEGVLIYIYIRKR